MLVPRVLLLLTYRTQMLVAKFALTQQPGLCTAAASAAAASARLAAWLHDCSAVFATTVRVSTPAPSVCPPSLLPPPRYLSGTKFLLRHIAAFSEGRLAYLPTKKTGAGGWMAPPGHRLTGASAHRRGQAGRWPWSTPRPKRANASICRRVLPHAALPRFV